MARAIDGELLELEIANIANKLAKSDAQKALMGRVMYCVEHMPTLTPPNEWVNRVRELDELYTKLQIVTGFTAEQLLEIFAAGYTLENQTTQRNLRKWKIWRKLPSRTSR